jgi:hypothetical protein
MNTDSRGLANEHVHDERVRFASAEVLVRGR